MNSLIINSGSQFFKDYFTCRICLETLDQAQEWVCIQCHAFYCLKCITKSLTIKKECIYNCGNTRFCRPPVNLQIIYKKAKVKSENCQGCYKGTKEFKVHLCGKTKNEAPKSIKEMTKLLDSLELQQNESQVMIDSQLGKLNTKMNESCQKFPIREVIFRLIDQYNPNDLNIEDQIDDETHDPDTDF